ncbi:hypothetical protein [Sphaerisporangium dianthi]|uniref:Peptidase M48 domain-containing protein n=1 Tax=Sphaerisporangium dianthi TaxID=1436120 RepID=A0ABV9CEY6_9ACTN
MIIRLRRRPDGLAPRSPRPDPLAMPSPARGRYLLLVIVMVLAGAFVGQNLHDQIWGKSWQLTMERCTKEEIWAQAGTGLAGDDKSIVDRAETITGDYRRQVDCAASAERRRMVANLGGASAVLILGVALMLLLPHRLLRRAGPLRTPPASWAARVETEARAMGLRRAPEVVFGSLRSREPFTVDRPGRARIVLPPGIVTLPSEQADAVIRHELAHVRAGDVTLVWLTRGVWWALPPILLIPPAVTFWPFLRTLAVAVFTGGDTMTAKLGLVGSVSLGMARHPIVADYGPRAVLLLALSAAVALAVLRSREHEADMRAAQGPAGGPLADLLRGRPETHHSWWRRLRAIHPVPSRRLAALERPVEALGSPAIDAFVVAMLATVVARDLSSMAPYGFGESLGMTVDEKRAAGLIAGSVLALGWGTALWRTTAAARIESEAVRTRRVTLAICGGALLGQMVSIRNTAAITQALFWTSNALMFLILPVVLAGAGACSIVFARRWALLDHAGRLTRQGYAAAMVVNVMVFVGGFWVGTDIATFMSIREQFSARQPDSGAWVRAYVATGVFSNQEVLNTVVLAAMALVGWWWITRSRELSPSPPVEGDAAHASSSWLYAGFIASMSCAAAVAASAVRWMAGSPVEKGVQFYTFQFHVLVPVCAGVACLSVLLILEGKAGLVPGIAAATVATASSAATVWFHRLATWSHPLRAMHVLGADALSMTLVVVLTLAPLAAFLPSRTPSHRPSVRWAAVAATALLTATLGITLLNSGTLLLVGG